MKSRVIFASLILGLGLATTQADAATTTNTDDSPAATKPASAMLINGSEKQFASYVDQHVTKFKRNTNWQNFINVVSLYNQNPANVLLLSAADQARFNEAATQVNYLLAKQKSADANRWKTQANYTARMMNFLWDIDRSNNEIVDAQ